MKLFLMLLLAFCLAFSRAKAQSIPWLYGTWNGETFFPNGPVTKRIMLRLQVTATAGNSFTATLSNLFPNDTTVRLEREITGKIEEKKMTVTHSEETYIRDVRTRNFWYDCTGCPVESNFSINQKNVVIQLTTTGCGDICNGITTFTRDTSTFDPAQKIQLAKWLGNSLPTDSNAARQVKKDTVLFAKKPIKDTAKKMEAAVAKAEPLLKKTTPAQPVIVARAEKAVAVADTLPKALSNRATNLIKTYQVTSPHIIIQLYDNAEIDGDVVSVFDNGKLIADHQSLTHKAITIAIDASAKNRHHAFVMVAENLGLIPPNTALMRIIAGSQKFELEVSSDFDNNAQISVDYTGN